jgi:hypothetical protein
MRRKSRVKKGRFNFPLSAEVSDVYLHNIRYIGLSDKRDYEAVILEFRRGSKYLMDASYFQGDLNYPNHNKYASATSAKKLKLERLGHVFLDRKTMAQINAKSVGIDEYVESLKKALGKVDYKRKKLIIKTVRDKKGFISLPNFGDYVRLEGSEKSFEYDEYEKKNINNFKTKR